MEVTKSNFKEALPKVRDSIEKADFLVIDAEFTGLINGKDVSVFDSPQEYYITLLNGSTEFLLIQFGLCAFYWDQKEKRYMNHAYNFYLFPRGRPGPEKMFLCQSSSLDFLAAQGFDFNKLVREGISYMTEPTETRLRDYLAERQKTYSLEKDLITIPEECKKQIEDICIKVRHFLDEKKSDEMEIERCNAFIRRLLFQELGLRFKKEAFVETKVLENKSRLLKVTRLTSRNECQDRDAQKKEKEWEELEDAVGFSKVARMISQSEKLVIGHNMLLDVLHTLNHFFQPLPPDYHSFKEFAHCMFPKVLDTKYMSSLPPFKDKISSSVLQHLVAALSEAPFTMPTADCKDGRGYNHTDDKHHEAGYDAYVTGLCFLSMYTHLAKMRGEPDHRITTADSAILKPFLNKLFLAKTAHQDSPYMNLAGADPTPSRDHVFHMTFPKEWQRNDINQLFSPFGPITVQFVDDTSALVALSRREQAKDVQRVIAECKRVSLIPYVKYKHMLAKTGQKQLEMFWRKPEEDSPCINTPESNQKQRLANTASTGSTSRATESPRKRPRSHSETSTSVQRVNSVTSSTSMEVVSSGSSTPVQRPHSVTSPTNLQRGTTVTSPTSTQRENCATSSAPERAGRKRTSSGVFKIDDAEPMTKKIELRRSSSEESSTSSTTFPNGRRKTDIQQETESGKENKKTKERKKITEKFDSKAKTNCVSTFKESDSWD